MGETTNNTIFLKEKINYSNLLKTTKEGYKNETNKPLVPDAETTRTAARQGLKVDTEADKSTELLLRRYCDLNSSTFLNSMPPSEARSIPSDQEAIADLQLVVQRLDPTSETHTKDLALLNEIGSYLIEANRVRRLDSFLKQSKQAINPQS